MALVLVEFLLIMCSIFNLLVALKDGETSLVIAFAVTAIGFAALIWCRVFAVFRHD